MRPHPLHAPLPNPPLPPWAAEGIPIMSVGHRIVHRPHSLSTPPALPLTSRNRWVAGSAVRTWIVADCVLPRSCSVASICEGKDSGSCSVARYVRPCRRP